MKDNKNTAMMPETQGLTDSDEPMYTITVDGEPMELTLEQLITAAEQGLSQTNEQAKREPEMMPMESSEDPQAYNRFLEAYPDVKPTEIPEQVWSQANRTGDLLEAYQTYQIMQLRQEIADLQMNQKNRERDVGSARSDGESKITDPIVLALMGKG